MTVTKHPSRFVTAVEPTFVLSKAIAGFEVPDDAEESRQHGAISEIAAGTILKLCGRGFTEQVAKVLANGRYYFVFLRDIRPAEI